VSRHGFRSLLLICIQSTIRLFNPVNKRTRNKTKTFTWLLEEAVKLRTVGEGLKHQWKSLNLAQSIRNEYQEKGMMATKKYTSLLFKIL
jgi:hypothetical protein